MTLFRITSEICVPEFSTTSWNESGIEIFFWYTFFYKSRYLQKVALEKMIVYKLNLKKFLLYKHTTVYTIQDKKEGVIWFFKIIILTELRWINTFVFVKHSMSRLHEETVVTRIAYSYHRSMLQRDTKSVVSGLVSRVLISQMKDCFLESNVGPCSRCYWV